MDISFYVLSENKAQDFLGFICQLTQTALNKSKHSLFILCDDDELVVELDAALWSNDATSFIPHQRLANANSHATDNNDSRVENTSLAADESLAPVLIGAYLPVGFSGIIINTTSRPVNDFITATSNAAPTRILEIIRPDDLSMQEGRNKYKRYKDLEYELKHFNV